MRMFRVTLCFCMALGLVGFLATTTIHAQKKDKSPKSKQVASGLDNPCGVAVQPGTGAVYIAAHEGVYWLNPAKKKKNLVIKGFKSDIYGKGPKYDIGPLGLAFMGKNLVVGDGSRPDGSELVYVFKLRDKVQTTKDAVHTLGPIKPSAKTAKGEGNFYGVAVGGGGIFFSCNGDDTKGWVARVSTTKDTLGPLEPFIATKVQTNVDAPVPLTFTKDGKELVVGQMGEINLPGDSLLTFYDPATGKLTKNLKTDLNDVTGLAYSPKTGKLYATDFSWLDTKKGGLFRLDVKGNSCKAVKITGLDKPTALAFDDAGNLYVTVFGTAKKDSKKKSGAVLMFAPGL